MRIIGPDEIRPHLSIAGLMEPMRDAMIALTKGETGGAITVLNPTAQSDMHIKSATMTHAPIFTVKMAGWSQARADRGLAPTTGLIAVYDSETCELLALLNDEHLISDYRTAAMGALIADGLARQNAKSLTVVGTGAQAQLQAEAVCHVRPIDRIDVWGRDTAKATRLASALKDSTRIHSVHSVTDLEAAVRNSDIVVCATAAAEPLVKGEWLASGQHITSVGADDATKAELEHRPFNLQHIRQP